MIITRKIQVYVCEQDKELKSDYIKTLYNWRFLVRKAANIIVSHKFVQQNVKDFVYIKDEIKEKFFVKDILNEGKGMSEQNTTYRVVSSLLKGSVPADIYSSLNQNVSKSFTENLKDMNNGKASVRSYRNNIPIPFSSGAISNIHGDKDGYFFTLFGIPFQCRFGADRSGNRVIVDRCISGEYKICGSSIQIDDDSKKMYLLLTVDIPVKTGNNHVKDKTLYVYLGVFNPIIATTDANVLEDDDCDMRVFEIGTREEFNHRRRQIQEAVKRCQIENRYTTGGKGRKRKTQALERFKEKEINYVETKLHTYSRMLVDLAVKHRCDTIYLMSQKKREQDAKDDELVLRNWSYYGLKQKIEYKAKMEDIKLVEK